MDAKLKRALDTLKPFADVARRNGFAAAPGDFVASTEVRYFREALAVYADLSTEPTLSEMVNDRLGLKPAPEKPLTGYDKTMTDISRMPQQPDKTISATEPAPDAGEMTDRELRMWCVATGGDKWKAEQVYQFVTGTPSDETIQNMIEKALKKRSSPVDPYAEKSRVNESGLDVVVGQQSGVLSELASEAVAPSTPSPHRVYLGAIRLGQVQVNNGYAQYPFEVAKYMAREVYLAMQPKAG